MGKPPRIKNKTAIFIGVLGFVGIVFNLWRSVFSIEKSSLDLFAYLLLSLFSTIFFSWLIFSNIRSNKEYSKSKKEKTAKNKS